MLPLEKPAPEANKISPLPSLADVSTFTLPLVEVVLEPVLANIAPPVPSNALPEAKFTPPPIPWRPNPDPAVPIILPA